ncbi:MAG: sulfotransferase family protein [Myxococcota bacterium]
MPDFAIIGAMKCGTSTLHEQLALRSGFFMSRPKEPNFFSDDSQFARGIAWYAGLFAGASERQLCGESSTHYTKLPTHPLAAGRMHAQLPKARLIYVMRDPVERAVSQYLHEWSTREVEGSLETAFERHERFVAYSCYARQLEPYVERWGAGSILPVFFERLIASPEEELARVCRFLGDPSDEPVRWRRDLEPQNVSSERLRASPLRDAVLRVPALRWLKDRLPQSVRDRAKRLWRYEGRPELSAELRRRIEARLDPDLARLGEWVGAPLSCRGWAAQVLERPLEWQAASARR